MRGTRFVFAASIVAFVGIAAITIVETAGYQVSWKPLRIQKVAGLSVLSTQRADVFVNDVYLGQTPIRRSALAPGRYHIRVERAGFVTWEAETQLSGGQAKIIGPLTLVPAAPTAQSTSLAKTDVVIPDTQGRFLFVAHPESEHIWTFRNQTQETVTSVVLSSAPRAITASDDGSSLYVQTASQALITTTAHEPWSVSAITDPRWAGISNEIVFGLRNDRLVVLDALRREEQILDVITSLATNNEALWTTALRDGATVVQMRDPSTPSIIKEIGGLSGAWRLGATHSGQVYLISPTSQVQFIRRPQLGSTTLTSFDHGDMFWQERTSETMIWRHGSEIMTLDKKNQPFLVDRWPTPVIAAWWHVDQDLLFLADQEHVIARSVQAQTGDRIVASWDIPTGSIGVASDQENAVWLQSATTLTRWTWPKN